jgi:quercetin dioxygenase-like cupin family protein
MKNYTENEIKLLLKKEGFNTLFTWTDSPNATYGDHTHSVPTAHIVLEGEITCTCQGKTVTYKVGERFDVPANTIHSAKIGNNGCTYIIGEK